VWLASTRFRDPSSRILLHRSLLGSPTDQFFLEKSVHRTLASHNRSIQKSVEHFKKVPSKQSCELNPFFLLLNPLLILKTSVHLQFLKISDWPIWFLIDPL
jgi:kynurenine formamidase